MRSRTLLFSVIAAAAAPALSLHAQDAKNYSYHSSARGQSAEEVEDIGEIGGSSSGTEGDGKSEPPAPIKSKFRFNVTTRSEYTSNAELSGSHSSSDFLFLPTVEAGYHTLLGEYFSFDLATKVESAVYASESDRGFVGYSANATLDFRPAVNAPRIYISAEPYRYDTFDTGDRVTQAVGLTAGTDYGLAFNNGHSLAFIGYSYTDYLSDPTIDNHDSHRIVAGVAHQLRQNLTGQLFYSWQYNDYSDISRHDSRNMVGGTLVYQISAHVFGNFTSAYVDNDSSFFRASYQSVTVALGLTVQF